MAFKPKQHRPLKSKKATASLKTLFCSRWQTPDIVYLMNLSLQDVLMCQTRYEPRLVLQTIQHRNIMSREISPIGKNIKKLRKQKRLSQDRLSKLADISYNTVIKLKLGDITNPSIDTLQRVAKALKCFG
jgi:DNA-binding XRE family transcriptional regulator